jgi:hypothetical protein
LEDLVNLFTNLPSEKKAQFLATVAHWATIGARADGYEPGTDSADGRILRDWNEFVHRVTGYIGVVLDKNEGEGQDESMMRMIMDRDWPPAAWTSFSKLLREP